MAVSFVCPRCLALVAFEDDHAGRRAPCSQCGAYVNVPERPAPGPGQFAAGEPPPGARPSLPPLESPQPVSGLPPATRAGDAPSSRSEGVTAHLPAYDPTPYDPRPYEEADRPYHDPREIALVSPAQGWNLVRIGLAMIYWAIVAMFIAILAYIAVAVLLIGMLGRRRQFAQLDEAAAFGVVVIVVIGAILGSFVVAVIGQGMCAAAPPESRVKGRAVASVICLIASVTLGGALVFGVFWQGLGFPRGGEDGPRMEVLVVMGLLPVAGLWFAGQILFVLFLRGVARFFRNDTLADSASNYLTVYSVYVTLNVLSTCLQLTVRDGGVRTFAGCMGGLFAIMGIVMLVWHLRLVAGARDTIAEALRRSY